MALFQFDPKAPIILVHAEVVGPKGVLTIHTMLDTGASYTMLHPDVLMRIGCEATSTRKQRITTASGIEIAVHDLPPTLPSVGVCRFF